MSDKKLKFGISLYSYANSFFTRKYDIEQCIASAKKLGFDGITIVAAQSAEEYPFISDEWLANLKYLMDKYEMEPICWEAYLDVGMRADRDMTKEEIIEYTKNDIIYAKKAGFNNVKTQQAITPEIFESMLPFCKKLGVKLNIEMHNPHHPQVPVWQEYFKVMARSDGYLGVCPDTSIFQKYPHQLHINQAYDEGCSKEKIGKALKDMAAGMSLDDQLKGDYSDTEKKYITEFYGKNGAPRDPEELRSMLPYSHMIHGKFYYLADSETDPCIPYEKIIPIIKEYGYNGYFVAEYEGHHFSIKESDEEQLSRFKALIEKLYAKA